MSDQVRVRKRLPRSCRRCHRRKQRCVGYPTCGNCESAQVACARSETVPSWHHAMSKEALVRRIETLEAQLSAVDKHTPSPERDVSSDLGLRSHVPAEPAYLGPSPGLSITTNLGQILHDVFWARSIPVQGGYQRQDPSPSPDARCNYQLPDEKQGMRLLRVYWDSVHIRFPFLCPQKLLECHAKRAEPLGPRPQDRVGRFKLFLVYAIGSSILRMTDTTGITPPSIFHRMALTLEPDLAGANWLDQAEGLMLLSMYQLRWSSTSNVWHWLGQAMRICTEHGLHSKSQYEGLAPREAERRLRLFWSVYIVERYFCWAIGRPFSLDEAEISAELPVGLNLRETPSTSDDPLPEPGLQRFTACIQLQRIASVIKNRFYRADLRAATLLPEIAPFMTALDRYQETLFWLNPDDREFIQMHWNNSIRVLLAPFIGILPPTDPLMQTCLGASGRLCQSFRKLQQKGFGYSFLLCNSIFVAGLTMCFCLLRAPHLWSTSASSDLRACSSAMSAMAEYNPILGRYRDTLETIIDRTMNAVAQSTALTPQDPTPSMNDWLEDLHPPSQSKTLDGHEPDSSTLNFDIDATWRDFTAVSGGAEDGGYWGNATPESMEKGSTSLLDKFFLEDLWSDDGMMLCVPPSSTEGRNNL